MSKRREASKRRFVRAVQKEWRAGFGPPPNYLCSWYEGYVAKHNAAPTPQSFFSWLADPSNHVNQV